MAIGLAHDTSYPHLKKSSGGSDLELEYTKNGNEKTKQLPLVLCGPILRRVTEDSVSVWIALMDRVAGMKLEIYEADSNGRTVGEPILASGTEGPKEFGENLHIDVMTAVSAGNSKLQRGKLYAYDIVFTVEDRSDGTMTKRLRDPGILDVGQNGLHRITPQGTEAPTFSLPPEKLDNLRVFYSSCRKPHGGRKGALSAVTKVLEKDATDAEERPHILFLGGDQIYGDDVADQLFAMVWNLGDQLLGVAERIKDESGEVSLQKFKPDHRQTVAGDVALLSAGQGEGQSHKYATSHLFGIGEYLAMYLCAWSDVLWPPEPEVSTVLPGLNQIYGAVQGESPYIPDHVSKKKDAVIPERWGSDDSLEDIIKESELKARRTEYRKTARALNHFHDDLQKVRIALANVPTYMTWDDHDVTDDWFVNGLWAEDVLGSELGHRIVQNGMLAAVICQMWGNLPAQYRPSKPGGKLLSKVEQGIAGGMKAKTESDPWNPAIQAEVDAWLGIPSTADASSGRVYKEGAWNRTDNSAKERLQYHFAMDWDDFGFVVLDNRTMRGFPSPEAAPEIISPHNQSVQFSDFDMVLGSNRDRNKPLLVLNPVPPWAVPTVDFAQDWGKYEKKKILNKLQTTTVHDIYENEYADYEHWRLQRVAMETIIHSLANRSKYIVNLSGDVHHGFTSRTEYWHHFNRGPGKKVKARFANLTSSAGKNEAGLTRILHNSGYLFDMAYGFAGWYKAVAPENFIQRELSEAIELYQKFNGLAEQYFDYASNGWISDLPHFLDHSLKTPLLEEWGSTFSNGKPVIMTTDYFMKGEHLTGSGIQNVVLLKWRAVDTFLEKKFPTVEINYPQFDQPIYKYLNTSKITVNPQTGHLVVSPQKIKQRYVTTYNFDASEFERLYEELTGESLKTTARDTARSMFKGLGVVGEAGGRFLNNLHAGHGHPHWEYRVDYLRGTKDFNGPLSQSSSGKKEYQKFINLPDFGSEIVGHDNVGEVQFNWSGDSGNVVHKLWWRMAGTEELHPWTYWTVNMSPGRERPSEVVQDTYTDELLKTIQNIVGQT